MFGVVVLVKPVSKNMEVYKRALPTGLFRAASKGTCQRDYSGLLENMGANRHQNSHGIFKGRFSGPKLSVCACTLGTRSVNTTMAAIVAGINSRGWKVENSAQNML